ncbi:DNA recombination protein RmuC [Sphingomonas nostoxanthinifaciens]|nr:DNA recombination protein RmuC [Sphingomonas nostoxanthinifaciens]
MALVAAIVGLIVGWILGGRPAALLRGERDRLDERSRAAETACAAAQAGAARADLLTRTLEAVTRERDEAQAALREFTGRQEERERHFTARQRELVEQKEALSAQFSEIGGKLLADAQRQFLERADQRFTESERLSGERLGALLQPVDERLKRYEEGVAKVEAERRDSFGALTGLIQSMREGQERVSGEAAKLVNALRNAPKARGRWGEQQLRNVLETCGLSDHADFRTEVSVEGDEGRLRPDVVVRVPGGRTLVIDAKVSLNAYQDAFGAIDEGERAVHLAAHAAAMRAHVNTLGGKAYQARFADSADYVVMFVPGEHFLAAALEQDPTLWDFAFDKRVLLATPTNLIAIARTVAAVWRQEKLAKEAAQIGALGKELYERLSTAAERMRRVGGGLTTAVNSYNAFVSSFESRALVTARKFRDLNIEAGGREIEEVAPVEALARYHDTPALPVDEAGEPLLSQAAE